MLNYRKSITVTGESVVGGVNIAYMNATISDNGEININRSIQNKELFETNKDAITADFKEFDEYAYSLISGKTDGNVDEVVKDSTATIGVTGDSSDEVDGTSTTETK